MAATCERPAAPAEADYSSGRFFSSLFGCPDEGQPGRVESLGNRSGMPTTVGSGGTLVTVQTQSAAQTKLVADLLDTAGAGEVSVGEGID